MKGGCPSTEEIRRGIINGCFPGIVQKENEKEYKVKVKVPGSEVDYYFVVSIQGDDDRMFIITFFQAKD